MPARSGNGAAAGQQATRFERARQAPTSGAFGGKAEEPPIIFRVADHHQRVAARNRRRVGAQHRRHQLAADAALLPVGLDRDRADQHHRRRHAIVDRQRDRPALDSADQRTRCGRGQAESANRAGARPQLIGGAAMPVGAEGAVEQRLDSRRIHAFDRHNLHVGDPTRQRARALAGPGRGARSFGRARLCYGAARWKTHCNWKSTISRCRY